VGNVVFVVAGCAVAHDGLARFGLPAAADFATNSGGCECWTFSLRVEYGA
jgi:hypothetical protein